MQNLEAPHGGDINRGTRFIVIAAVFGSVSTLTTAIRVTVRIIKRQFGYDDFAISLATGLVLIELVFNGLEYHEGAGRHAFYLSERQQQRSLMWNYVTQYLIFLIICVTKVGICLFILRIKNTGWLRWCLYALMTGLVLTTIPCIIILSAQCRPLRALWMPGAGTCWSRDVYNDAIWAQVAYSIFSDLICSLLPVVVLWNVNVSKSLKVAVCGLMSVGLLYINAHTYLEENFGIIGANLAMSRAIYVYMRDLRQAPDRGSRYPQPSHLGDRQPRSATGWQRKIYASSKSQDSMIPLEESAIKKTTDLSVTQEPRSRLSKAGSNLDFDGRTFLVEDQV
ncbi:MAG: hypothetical protein Q9228_002274 [Teloschistes exilis]